MDNESQTDSKFSNVRNFIIFLNNCAWISFNQIKCHESRRLLCLFIKCLTSLLFLHC